MSAKAVAKHYATLIGEVDGVRLLSPATLEKALEIPRTGEHGNGNRCLGYKFINGFDPRPQRTFGHAGVGGSLGIAFIDDELSIGFAKNRMGTSASEQTPSGDQIIREIRTALGLGS